MELDAIYKRLQTPKNLHRAASFTRIVTDL